MNKRVALWASCAFLCALLASAAHAAPSFPFRPEYLPQFASALHLSGTDAAVNVVASTSGIANSVTTLNPDPIGGGTGRGDYFTQTTAASMPIFTAGQGLVFSGTSSLTEPVTQDYTHTSDNWQLLDASFDCTAGSGNQNYFFYFGGSHAGGDGMQPGLSCVKSVSGLAGPQLDLQYGLVSGTNDVYIAAPAAGKHSVFMYLTAMRLPCMEVDGGTPSCGTTPVYQPANNNHSQFGAGQPFTLINFWQGADTLTPDQINMLAWWGDNDAGVTVPSSNPYSSSPPMIPIASLPIIAQGTPVQNDRFRNPGSDYLYDPVNQTCACAHDESHQGTLLSSTGYLTGATQQYYNNFSGGASQVQSDASYVAQSGVTGPAYSPEEPYTTAGPGQTGGKADSSEYLQSQCVVDTDTAGTSRLDFLQTNRSGYNGYYECSVATAGQLGQGFSLGNGASTVRIFQWATWEIANGTPLSTVPEEWPANWLRTVTKLTVLHQDNMEFDAPELYSNETSPTVHITPWIHAGERCPLWLHFLCKGFGGDRLRSNAMNLSGVSPWSNYITSFFDASGSATPVWCANSAGPIIPTGSTYPSSSCTAHIWTAVFDPSIAEVITYLDGYELTRTQYNKVWLDPIFMIADGTHAADCTGGPSACPGPYHERYMYWWGAWSKPAASNAVAP